MVRLGLATAFVLLMFVAPVPAQTPPRHRWQTGQVLVYKTDHATEVTDTVGDTKVETKSQVSTIKRWQVLNVDAAGIATLQMSVTALRFETLTPRGEKLLFDSAHPEKNDPATSKQMALFVGQPLAVLRLDAQGQLIEVKESKFGPASRFEKELPFTLVLPPVLPQANQTWERAFKITLEPPQGTGEKFDAVQHYTFKSVTAEALTIALTTEMKTQPEAIANQLPLLQSQPQGVVVFDLQAGRMRSATLNIEKELKGHQGENSSYRFISHYTEQYIGDK